MLHIHLRVDALQTLLDICLDIFVSTSHSVSVEASAQLHDFDLPRCDTSMSQHVQFNLELGNQF